MMLPIPVVGVDPGPDYATNINNCLTIIDGHNHSSGYGVAINPAGLDINTDLSFQGNDAFLLRSVRFSPQPTPEADVDDLGCLYESGVDLYYNDGSGNQIRITQSGGVAGTPGSISNLVSPASATYVALDQAFVWESGTNIPANMDNASVTIRNQSVNAKGVTLDAPAALGANYNITLPLLPLTQSFMTLDAAGNMAAPWTVDGTSITIVANQLTAPSAAVSAKLYMTHQWQLNGPYGTITYPQTEVDGYCFFNFNATILAIWIYNATAGTSGTTEFDLKLGSSGGSFSSILSTTGKITSAAASGVWTDSGSVVGSQTGVTKPVMTSANVNAGQALRFDVIQSMAGTSSAAPLDCGVIIHFIPR